MRKKSVQSVKKAEKKVAKKAKASRSIEDQIKEVLGLDEPEKKVAKKSKSSKSIQDQIRGLLGVEPFDYLKCIELCIKFGKKKHHIDDSKDDLLGLAKYESCLG